MTEEEKLSIKEQFNCIVKDGIVPVLKSAGFRKKGNNFHAHVGELDWCINIQTDRWGFDVYSNTWQFTINIGVTWDDYAICLFNEVCDFPLENSCPIRTRIGNFIGKEDYWFILHPNQDCSPIKDLICSTLQNKVLPLLKQHQCLNDLWGLIEDSHSRHTFLIKLFHVRSKQKVFWTTPLGLYMLCLATGKTKKAKLLRSKMEQRKANTSLLDKIQKHTNSSGIMKQTDDISKVLSAFKTLAATQAAATENGDYKKGNKVFKQIIKIIKYLKGLGRVRRL